MPKRTQSPKKLISLRVAHLTHDQIEQLQDTLGMSKTEVIILAVDRLYQAEIAKGSAPASDTLADIEP